MIIQISILTIIALCLALFSLGMAVSNLIWNTIHQRMVDSIRKTTIKDLDSSGVIGRFQEENLKLNRAIAYLNYALDIRVISCGVRNKKEVWEIYSCTSGHHTTDEEMVKLLKEVLGHEK